MINHSSSQRCASVILLACLCTWAVHWAEAQFVPPGGGAPGGGGTTTGRTGSRGGSSGSTARDYGNNTQVGDAMISSDPETRKLFIITDDETALQISQVVSNLDRPKPQVLIKVVFLEITHNTGSDIGIEGSYGKNFGNSFVSGLTTNFGVVSNAVVPTSIIPGMGRSFAGGSNIFGLGATGTTAPGAGLYQVLGQDYTVTLRAIAQAGNAEVVSRPSILTRNSQPATITVGQSVPLISNVRFDTFGNAINSVTYTDVGVILRVTPFISHDSMVEMILSPELSSVSATETVPISAGVNAPVIDKRTADTVVVTPDGQTVIVGGLMGRTKTQADSKIPFLGDIPLLGNLFKRKVKSDVKTELMIFLTPHVVRAPGQLAALSASEQTKLPMTPNQFTEDELNKFLDGLPIKKPADTSKKAPKKK